MMLSKTILHVAALAVFLGWGIASTADAQWYVDPNQTSRPVWQSPLRYQGFSIDPRTGYPRSHTSGATVYDSYRDPFRNAPPHPAQSWHVDRWEFDQFGNPVRIRGQQWINPVTGQVHGDLQRNTTRSDGSSHSEDIHFRRMAPQRPTR